MPRRVTLTDRQKDALLRLPTSQTDLLKHYTLSDEDLGHIRLRRRAHNRFGFALGVWGAMEPKTNVSSESHRKGAFRSPAHPPGITL